jgi:ABC-2 type transport system ATP-binding protein
MLVTTNAAIEAVGVTKAFGDHRVLQGLDLTVPQGTVFCLLGPNGAGKTTTVRILSTLTRPDSGSVRVAGLDGLADRRQVRRRISLTGQYAAVDASLTGAENLRMVGRLAGLTRQQARCRADELLAQFDLTDAADRRSGSYSGGMRRRLDLAAGLVSRPEVVFLDEPTTGLDLPGRQAMWQVITGLAGSGVTIFLTTQYLEEADQLADRVAVLDGGQIIANDSPHALKQQVGGRRLDLQFADAQSFDAALRLLARRAVRHDRPELSIAVATDGAAGRVRALLDEIDPGRVGVRGFALNDTTLDAVFLALVGQSATAAPGQQSGSQQSGSQQSGSQQSGSQQSGSQQKESSHA